MLQILPCLSHHQLKILHQLRVVSLSPHTVYTSSYCVVMVTYLLMGIDHVIDSMNRGQLGYNI